MHAQHSLARLPCTSTVSAIGLDDWLQTNSVDRIDFIKLDIEGSELDALARRQVERCPVFIPQLSRRLRAVGTTMKSDSCSAPQAMNVVLFAGTRSLGIPALNRWHAS